MMPDFIPGQVPVELRALPIWRLLRSGAPISQATSFGTAHSAFMLAQGAAAMAVETGPVPGGGEAIIAIKLPPGSKPPHGGWPTYVEQSDDGSLIALARCSAADYARIATANGVLSGPVAVTGKRCPDAPPTAPSLTLSSLATLGVIVPAPPNAAEGDHIESCSDEGRRHQAQGRDLPAGGSEPLLAPFQARSGTETSDTRDDPDDDDDELEDTASPALLTPNPDGVPLYLTNLPRWLLWRVEHRTNKQTREVTETKPPISCRTGQKCDVTDPRSWTDFARVKTAVARSAAWDGFGIALGYVPESREYVIGIDADACLDPETGALADWAAPYVTTMGSYTEYSPGGVGLKSFGRIREADYPAACKLLGIAEGAKEQARTRTFGERANGGHAPGVQMFVSGRYFTATGRAWHASPEDVCLLSLDQIAQLGHLFGPKEQRNTADRATAQRTDDDEAEPEEVTLRDRLGAEFLRNTRLKERWEGGTAGLSDTSRSGFDMSILAFLVTAGFTKGETRTALRAYRYGKLAEEEAAGTGDRYFQRMWDRSAASPRSGPNPSEAWERNHPPVDAVPATEILGRQPDPELSPKVGRILTGDDFISSFVPPDWLIEGVVQRGRLYACTSLTGHGKTAAWGFNACMIQAGRMIGNLDVVQGNVLYLAGENPEDLKARMHGMVGYFKLKPAQLPFVLPGNFPLDDQEADTLLREIDGLGVPISLIIGDTASSFFSGEDENDNVQAGGYARTLRRFTLECPGNPTVVVLCHPVKNASKNNLLPRGGGAFVNELDANLTLWSESQGEVTELHWQGKIRGPDFSALGYRLRPVPTGFIDRRDRPVMTIVAEPMSEEAVADHTKQTLANEDVVLRALRDHPEWSYAQIAREAGWVDENDQPMKPRVQRAIRSLADDKLVVQPRKGARWELTEKGEKAAGTPNHG
jgi:hypothetical protein